LTVGKLSPCAGLHCGNTAPRRAAVNDCTLQPIIHDLPFGGVGNSGMGKYHGEWGFRAYTNARGVLYHSTRLDLGVRYPPPMIATRRCGGSSPICRRNRYWIACD
jgi:hypothetical protein